jgi:hypothetical protein
MGLPSTISTWGHKETFAIGGLHNVGFAPNSDYLIVLSSQGQGIFDCIKGEKIARSPNFIRRMYFPKHKRIATSDMDAYHDFYRNKLATLPNITTVQSFFVLSETKSITAYPI